HIHLHGGTAPVRRYLPELIKLVLNGKINPGKVFGYQSSCQHRELVGGAQAPLLRVPLADGTLVATSDVPSEDLIPSLLTLSDVMGTGRSGKYVTIATENPNRSPRNDLQWPQQVSFPAPGYSGGQGRSSSSFGWRRNFADRLSTGTTRSPVAIHTVLSNSISPPPNSPSRSTETMRSPTENHSF